MHDVDLLSSVVLCILIAAVLLKRWDYFSSSQRTGLLVGVAGIVLYEINYYFLHNYAIMFAGIMVTLVGAIVFIRKRV